MKPIAMGSVSALTSNAQQEWHCAIARTALDWAASLLALPLRMLALGGSSSACRLLVGKNSSMSKHSPCLAVSQHPASAAMTAWKGGMLMFQPPELSEDIRIVEDHIS